MLITPEYAALNREKHAIQHSGFGIHGHSWAGKCFKLAQQMGARSILDYGAGKGTFAEAFRALDNPVEPEFQLFEYDPGFPGKETKPLHADMVVSTDVLEHVEPDCLYAVLDDIRNIARIGVFFVIPMIPALKVLPDGRNAHLIVEPAEWWLPKLIQRWKPKVFLDIERAFMFVGERK